jgi:hypothetical protein
MTRLTKTGIGLVAIGVICGVLESTLYGNRLDENNVVQDSLFLPLSIFALMAGAATLTLAGVRWLLRRKK